MARRPGRASRRTAAVAAAISIVRRGVCGGSDGCDEFLFCAHGRLVVDRRPGPRDDRSGSSPFESGSKPRPLSTGYRRPALSQPKSCNAVALTARPDRSALMKDGVRLVPLMTKAPAGDRCEHRRRRVRRTSASRCPGRQSRAETGLSSRRGPRLADRRESREFDGSRQFPKLGLRERAAAPDRCLGATQVPRPA